MSISSVVAVVVVVVAGMHEPRNSKIVVGGRERVEATRRCVAGAPLEPVGAERGTGVLQRATLR